MGDIRWIEGESWKRIVCGVPLVLLAVLAWGFPQALGSETSGSEGEKMKEMQEMFSSEYQEEDYYRTDRLLISATGSLKPVHKAPSVATVITAEDIERMGATSLDEVLETVPGLHVSIDSLMYGSSIWSIRGIHTTSNPHALLLLNGLPFQTTTIGTKPQNFRMPVAMISRVEVVRGPGSAVYGADAFSGVINVITKDSTEVEGTTVGLRYGSFQTHDLWLQHGGNYRGWDVLVSVENQRSQGDDGRIIEQDRLGAAPPSLAPGPWDSRYETVDTHLDLRKDNWTLRLYGNWLESNAGPGGLQVVTFGNDIDKVHALADLTYRNVDLVRDWDLSLRLNTQYLYNDTLLQFFPSEYFDMIGNPIYKENNSGLDVTAIYSGFAQHQFRFGAGIYSYETNTDQYRNFIPGAPPVIVSMYQVTDPDAIYLNDQNRQLYYGLFQDEWSLARRWEFTVGVRYDMYSDIGSTTNPRAALVWETRPDLTTKLLYGRAFRAPSFVELYNVSNPVVLGNEDLEPEIIDTGELVFDYQPMADLRSILSLYTYNIEGLIEYAGPAPSGWESTAKQAINSRDVEGYGFELEVDWQVTDSFQLKSNFARQRAKDENTGELIPDAPGMQFWVNGHWIFEPDWSIDVSCNWVGDRKRAAGDSREEIDDYSLVGLVLRRKNIKGHWDAALAVKNLFDSDAREPSLYDEAAASGAYIPYDYPLEGRSVWAEVRYSF